MVKRLIILLSLLGVLFLLVEYNGSKPAVGIPVEEEKDGSTKYITKEYTISKIEGTTYLGKANDGTGISFNGNVIIPGNNIEKNDKVICYFEKGNAGRGIVKVEEKTEK
ncbi:hypothetical protein [Bacillus massilinigeriensis]|uniref:hypothetical protein n=1 Tax=Bacillus mediterraneensis TaxID=1805474 RepID=UPI0008F94BF7|nr:hypothetical protein [Bacillus mediterraneensis]